MVLIQMLLPTKEPTVAGVPDTMAALAETRRELADSASYWRVSGQRS